MGAGNDRFTVRFWGVRGSIPSPGPDTVRYGGNTSCVQVWCGDTLFILDAGSGLRRLGVALDKLNHPVAGHILLSHLHWDHIQGIPFFTSAYRPGNKFDIYGCKRQGHSLKDNLVGQMTQPNFPVPLSVMQSTIKFHEIHAGDEFDIGDVHVRTAALNHPGGAMGVRLEYDGKAVAYCSDHEHESDRKIHPGLESLGRDADLLIYDATYTEEEYPARAGWGHSTWEVACEIAPALNLKRLAIFHHEPTHDDDKMDEIAAAAAARFPAAIVAKEGMEIEI